MEEARVQQLMLEADTACEPTQASTVLPHTGVP